MRDTIVSAAREVGILCRTANQMRRASRSIARAFATAERRTVLLNKDNPALLRARRRHLAWTEREQTLSASHRARVEGVHGEEKAWHGLARAARRGLANMKIQAYLTAAAVNLKRLAVAIAVLLMLLFRSGSLDRAPPPEGRAFATAPGCMPHT
jgi:Transposase DDE domain